MKTYINAILFSILSILLLSCRNENKIQKIDKNQSLSSILNKDNHKHNVLLFIKNDDCDVCKEFYKYVETNFENLISPKLPEDTKVYLVSINNFNSPNMWLFHILEGFSFPTVLYIEKGMEIKAKFKGGDLYSFDNFLTNLNNKKIIEEPKISLNADELKKYSILLRGYINLKENNNITVPMFKQVAKINSRTPNFISALLEGYYYKNNKIFPERVTFIKDFLQKNITKSNSYFVIQQKLVQEL